MPAGQNILGLANILDYPDVHGSASTAYVDGWIEINVSQDGGATWGGWQKFVLGVFPGNAWNFRLALESEVSSIIATVGALSDSRKHNQLHRSFSVASIRRAAAEIDLRQKGPLSNSKGTTLVLRGWKRGQYPHPEKNILRTENK